MARLRLFALLREIAGTGSVEIPGETVEEVVGNATARFGPDFADALRTAQTWLNGERAGPATRVVDGDEIALIPPDAPAAVAVGDAGDEMGRVPDGMTH